MFDLALTPSQEQILEKVKRSKPTKKKPVKKTGKPLLLTPLRKHNFNMILTSHTDRQLSKTQTKPLLVKEP